MIKNLVFDLGGVLVKIALQGCVDRFKELGFKNVDEYLNPYAQEGAFGDLESGIISDEEFRQIISKHCGKEISWEECQYGWLGFMVGVIEPNLEELTRLLLQKMERSQHLEAFLHIAQMNHRISITQLHYLRLL